MAFGTIDGYVCDFILKNPTLSVVATFQDIRCCEMNFREFDGLWMGEFGQEIYRKFSITFITTPSLCKWLFFG